MSLHLEYWFFTILDPDLTLVQGFSGSLSPQDYHLNNTDEIGIDESKAPEPRSGFNYLGEICIINYNSIFFDKSSVLFKKNDVIKYLTEAGHKLMY